MGLTIAEKIIGAHLVKGDPVAGREIALKIDQTLTQDSTGTMAYLQFEALGIDRVRTKRSVAYIDHNMLQTGPENADDHLYIQTVAKKHGIIFSRPGNGICHQVHLERFSVPGETLLGSDSHTPTCGGAGMLAVGAGGLDVAIAMGGGEYYLTMPQIVRVNLLGKPAAWTTAKDVILELLRRLTVKGGIGKIFEYGGDGLRWLTVPQRATIANMGAELGATSSIFPSDPATRNFFRLQGREDDYRELTADHDAAYSEVIDIDLGTLVPLAACPHSPDKVVPVAELAGIKVDQVAIGSCTNSSYSDMATVAQILAGRTVAEGVSLVIAPGSRQVLNTLARDGALAQMVQAGARVLECACGPCIGMGQAPRTGAVSLRTFNRNFPGRSGTPSAQVYLVSPEVAAASALRGYITDPRGLGEPPVPRLPESFAVADNLLIFPSTDGAAEEIVRGPNIKPFPRAEPPADTVTGRVLIKVGDNITTDHIMPSTSALLPYRSNIPYLADYCLTPCDPDFPAKAKANGGGIIVGGANYGQGSSREHAALVPLYLGIKAVLAKSFARIHQANLVNNGILPLTFVNPEDYDRINELDELAIAAGDGLAGGEVLVRNVSTGGNLRARLEVSERQKIILRHGGLLNLTRQEKA